jgi:hypothetical protein
MKLRVCLLVSGLVRLALIATFVSGFCLAHEIY